MPSPRNNSPQPPLTAADALVEIWPEIERDTAFGAVLRANAINLVQASGMLLCHPDAHAVLFRTGRSLGETGQVNAAVSHFQQLITATHNSLGPDHLATLTTRGNLARWRGEAGDPAGAASALQELLTDHLRILGPDHPRTLTTRGNLAHWRNRATDSGRAN